MSDESRALVRLVGSAVSRRRSTAYVAATATCGTGALALFLAGWPLLSLATLVVLALASIGIVTCDPFTSPDAIASVELRVAYLGVLASHDEVVSAAARTPGQRATIGPAVARCHDTAVLAGELALLANPIQAYLDAHPPLAAQADAERLQRLLEHADPDSAKVLAHAGETRGRLHDLHTRLVERQAQLVAKLELARATLDEVAATIVELGASEHELAPAFDVTELDVIADELRALASGFAAAGASGLS